MTDDIPIDQWWAKNRDCKKCAELKQRKAELEDALKVVDKYFEGYAGHIPYEVCVAVKGALGDSDE